MRVRWWRSLRLRIALSVTVVSAALMIGSGLVISHETLDAARDRLRDQAIAHLDAATQVYSLTGDLDFGASVDPEAPPAPLRAEPVGQRWTYYDGHTMWAATRLSSQILVSVEESGRDLASLQRTLRMSMIAVAAVGLPLAALLGWAAGTGLSRRLRRSAATAADIGRGSPARVHATGHDEAAALGRAVNAMADSLDARLREEQAFTGEVAHELRTPTTALVSAAELLPPGPEADITRRLVGRLRALVEDLLEVSRLESGHEQVALVAIPITDLVRPDGAVDAALQALGVADLSEVRDPATVLAEPRRVERILANLVANAVRHGGGAPRISVDGARIVVADDGPGFPQDLLEDGPRRFHHGEGGGTGLGLVIAARQAAVMGARVELSNAPEGGARATVVFTSR
ncbi:HAMP domain-containing sensor histidine kinase [Nocardioides sp.]|uniref:sensor histidine kinase n=1 Tax=Nocardioides sp. TaxID=35761 RepID=UPI00262E69E6|nr:HAMP domain-containing sensor histidine kinase [Nocardioides sp.]